MFKYCISVLVSKSSFWLQLLYLLLVNILIHIHCTIIHLYLLLNCRREPCYYSNYIGLLFRCLAAICVGWNMIGRILPVAISTSYIKENISPFDDKNEAKSTSFREQVYKIKQFYRLFQFCYTVLYTFKNKSTVFSIYCMLRFTVCLVHMCNASKTFFRTFLES